MCHQDVVPERFELAVEGFDSAELQTEALARDVAVLKHALAHGRDDLAATLAEVRLVDDELRAARRTMTSVVTAHGQAAEALAKAAHDLADAEAARERWVQLERTIDGLQQRIRAWIEDASGTIPTTSKPREDEARVASFVKWFRSDLQLTGHTAVAVAPNGVRLDRDEDYRPLLEGRELRGLGAGSDPARLVLAYSTGLLRAAMEVGGYHPGFLIADEPKQQNPDSTHELLSAAFWKALAPWLDENGGQAIVFTSLRHNERGRLAAAGVPVQVRPETRLLRPVRALPTEQS